MPIVTPIALKSSLLILTKRNNKLKTTQITKKEKKLKKKITTSKADPKYGRHVKFSTKFKAHDENNEAKIGDIVEVMETRPLSKDKRWRLVEIMERAK